MSAASIRTRPGISTLRYLGTSSVRCAGGKARTGTGTGTEPGPGLTGSSKLYADAAAEEGDGTAGARFADPNDAVWTGEERVQDTVLRMLMDKYKPLRVHTHTPVQDKLQSVQQPQQPGPAPQSWPHPKPQPQPQPQHEDGRRLPKTPDNKPWRAVYVQPAVLGNAGPTPSVHYGKLLQPKSAAQKLKDAGIKLPLDDAKVSCPPIPQTTTTTRDEERFTRSRSRSGHETDPRGRQKDGADRQD